MMLFALPVSVGRPEIAPQCAFRFHDGLQNHAFAHERRASIAASLANSPADAKADLTIR
jgi:hypothetical protein